MSGEEKICKEEQPSVGRNGVMRPSVHRAVWDRESVTKRGEAGPEQGNVNFLILVVTLWLYRRMSQFVGNRSIQG